MTGDQLWFGWLVWGSHRPSGILQRPRIGSWEETCRGSRRLYRHTDGLAEGCTQDGWRHSIHEQQVWTLTQFTSWKNNTLQLCCGEDCALSGLSFRSLHIRPQLKPECIQILMGWLHLCYLVQIKFSSWPRLALNTGSWVSRFIFL